MVAQVQEMVLLMAKLMNSLLGITLLFGNAAVMSAQAKNEHVTEGRDANKLVQDSATGTTEKNIEVMMDLFRSVEQHDDDQERQMEQPNVEFHWPPSLYGKETGFTWSETWLLLQPTATERQMDPRVVAASGNNVAVLFHQRGVSRTGDRFDGEVLGLYELRDGKLARAQMFYFDTAAVASFLAKALTPELRQRARTVFDRYKSLPVQRAILVRKAYEELWGMTKDKRQLELASERFKSRFTPHERDLLINLLGLTFSQEEQNARN